METAQWLEHDAGVGIGVRGRGRGLQGRVGEGEVEEGHGFKEPPMHVGEFGLSPICQRFPDFGISFITKKINKKLMKYY